jgi:hypothetical protein
MSLTTLPFDTSSSSPSRLAASGLEPHPPRARHYAALAVLADCASRELADDRALRSTSARSRVDAQQAELDAGRAKVEHEKHESLLQLGVGLLSAAASVVAAVAVVGYGVSVVVSSAVQACNVSFERLTGWWSKTHGPQGKADDRQLDEKSWESLSAEAQATGEEVDGEVAAARAELQLAERLLAEHAERRARVEDQLARTAG